MGIVRNCRRCCIGTRLPARRRVVAVLVLWTLSTASGCVYFNTYYNARKFFRQAEKQYQADTESGQRMSPSKQQYQDAIDKAAKIVQKHPKSKYHDDALFLIGVSYFRMENYTKSESAFRELLATHPQSTFIEESRLYLARCRIELGDEQAGFRTFSELATTARKPEWRAEALYQRGQFFANHGAPDSAAAVYQSVLDQYPHSERAVAARLHGAEMLRRLGRQPEAIALYRPLEDHDDPSICYQARMGTGQSYYEAGVPDSGIAIFSAMVEASEFSDSLGAARLQLAHGLRRAGKIAAARRQYEQVAAAFEATRWAAEAYFNLAEIAQYEDDDLVAARELYDHTRQAFATGELATLALARSANISKLEQFRKELGRAELSHGASVGKTFVDPTTLPRLERLAMYELPSARPLDYVPPQPASVPLADSTETSTAAAGQPGDSLPLTGPPLPATAEIPAAPTTQAMAVDTLASTAQAGSAYGDSLYGPMPSPTDLAEGGQEVSLPSEPDWRSILENDSLFGPPPPVYLYAVETGPLVGPLTPPDSVLAAAREEKDRLVREEREGRAAARTQRKEEFAAIEAAATTQLQLAELYRFDLGYPDSALVEYNGLVERYPGSPFAAQALLGAADLYASHFGDTAAATARLERLLREYPYTDYASDAIVRLGLQGSPSDTAHPGWAYAQAEAAFVRDGNPRRAIKEFQSFIQCYPHSRLIPQAEYAIAVLTDRYFPRADSSVVWAYQEITTSYPESELALAAQARLTPTIDRPKRRTAPPAAKGEGGEAAKGESGQAEAETDSSAQVLLPRAPRPKVVGQLVYPSSEIGSDMKEHYVVYRILIDFSGDITQYDVIQPSKSNDINLATEEALKKTSFWADSIPPDSLNMWYKYEIKVTPPASEMDEWQRHNIDQTRPDQSDKP